MGCPCLPQGNICCWRKLLKEKKTLRRQAKEQGWLGQHLVTECTMIAKSKTLSFHHPLYLLSSLPLPPIRPSLLCRPLHLLVFLLQVPPLLLPLLLSHFLPLLLFLFLFLFLPILHRPVPPYLLHLLYLMHPARRRRCLMQLLPCLRLQQTSIQSRWREF